MIIQFSVGVGQSCVVQHRNRVGGRARVSRALVVQGFHRGGVIQEIELVCVKVRGFSGGDIDDKQAVGNIDLCRSAHSQAVGQLGISHAHEKKDKGERDTNASFQPSFPPEKNCKLLKSL